MKTRDWLAAHDAGKVVHDLNTIEMTDGRGRVCRLPVSADALRVIEGGEQDRRSGGAHASETMAQRLGGFMLTPKLLEERHIRATVILQPLVSGLIKPGGTINNTTDIEHSRAIDRAIDGCPNFTAWEAAPAQCKAGPWMISNLGKPFAINHECTEDEGTNYGWFVHKSAVRNKGGQWFWVNASGQSVVRVHPCDWSKDWFAIQPSAQAHGFGEDTDQDDYCVAPGTKVLTSDLRWVNVEELLIGDELIAFGEQLGGRNTKRPSIVEGITHLFQERYAIETTRGTVISSGRHRWAASTNKRVWGKARWTRTAKLKPGMLMPYLCDPWEQDLSWDGAWMAGFLDGEGWISGNAGVAVAQNPGPLLDRTIEIIKRNGFAVGIDSRSRCVKIRPQGACQGMRMLGIFRPLRLMKRSRETWEDRRVWGNKSRPAKILRVTPLGPGPVIGLQTSTKTFFAEGFFSHNSQFIALAGGEAWVSDGGDVPTSSLYTDPALSVFATFDGKPLKWARHPGVPLIVPARDETPPPPDTEPAPPPSLAGKSDPELMWGARMVEWMEEHRTIGTREVPDGSNNGPAISVWLGRSIRERVGDAFGPWLADVGGPWCAASASGGAAFETHMAGDGVWPFLMRASGFELEEDAKRIGVWWAVEALLDGSVELEPGDVCILPRGKPGSWQRHVCLFIRYVDRTASPPLIETIGGNERNEFRLTTRRLTDLLGAIPMPDGEEARPAAHSDTTIIVMPELVIEARAELEAADHIEDGDNVLLDLWDRITPQPWRLHEPHGVKGHARWWCSDRDSGIHVLGEPRPRRTKGKPITLGKIVAKYGEHIEEASARTGVPVRLIAAMVATEAGLNERAERYERHINDWSFGAAQTLTETAWAMAHRLNVKQPDRPVPRGGSPDEWRAFLFDPRISIILGSMYLAYNDERFGLQWDPVLAYAGYNAGSPLVRLEKSWGLAHYTYDKDKDGISEYDAIDTFAAWYGDAAAVYSNRDS